MLLREFIFKSIQKTSDDTSLLSDIYRLLEDVLKMDRVHLFAAMNQEITADEIKKFDEKYHRYCQGEPLQYILGYTYFYGEKFMVDSRVLIPRFDSETLIEVVLQQHDHRPLKVIDLGTGSGNLAITLKKHRPQWSVSGLDCSQKALEVASMNATAHLVDITWICEDMVNHIQKHPNDYDIIVCNPPYIAENDVDVDSQVRSYEPALALFAKNDGLYYYQQLLTLHPRCTIYFEIGFLQADAIVDLAHDYEVKLYQDMAHHPRVIVLQPKKDKSTNNP